MANYAETEHLAETMGHKIDVSVIEPKGPAKGNVLYLHGAGESSKERLLPLARSLGNLGHKGVIFSLPGHGKSSGTLLGSTLAERRIITEAIGHKFQVLPADMIVAVSMAGHTAISMLETPENSFRRLALFAPAAYSHEAEKAPFGPKFSEIIRRPKSYHKSKAWDILPRFKGQLVIFQAELDEVIPPEVIDMIGEHSTSASQNERVILPGAPHRLTTWMSEHPHRLEAIATALDSFNFDGLPSKL
ncbi:MAG TPA: alpha/beta hydrolase [Patescibacteria group bacterium]|nr:alpha/beta hydrolase [Patescibacteria group bacterium]